MKGLTYIAIVLCAVTAKAQPIIWVLDGMQRISPTTAPGAGVSITLHAAKNEYEPFQIAIRAPAQGLTDVTVTASPLNGPSGAVIPASDITLYREHFIQLARGSSDWEGSNRPGGAGWYPEPLLPLEQHVTSIRNAPSTAELRGTPLQRLVLPWSAQRRIGNNIIVYSLRGRKISPGAKIRGVCCMFRHSSKRENKQ